MKQKRKIIRKRSELEKHLTIKNCHSTFLKNILRFEKQKDDLKSTTFRRYYQVKNRLKTRFYKYEEEQ